MALTLRDVVESRASQRTSHVRRDAAETRDAVEGRRERFSLEDADRRSALDSRLRASTAARVDAARSRVGKPDSAVANAPKPAAAEPEGGKTSETRADRSEPQDETVREKDGPARSPDTDRAARPEAPAKPIPGKSALPDRATPFKAEAPVAEQADVQGAEGEPVESLAAAVEGQSETVTVPQADTAASAAPLPMMAIPSATPPPVVSAPAQGTSAGGAKPEGEADIAVADSATGGTAPLAGGNTAARGSATAKAGFDAALAEIASEGAGDDAAAALTSRGTEPSAVGGGTATLPASTEAKTAPAVQQPAPAAPAPTPVPLGAVPMTIGLRALGASNRFEIRLDPKELGRIDVSIDIDKESGTVGARLVVDRPETLALLQRDASSLQQALAQTGLDASAGISLSLRSDSENQRSGAGSDAQARRGGQIDRNGRESGIDQVPIDLVPLRALRGLGRVDIRI
ncbi:flagellar hook-length control protein FliK [Methylobacterium haplocladii]|uniref:Flagellar hook-length control protein-like C-terminal domain-containing protein n=1 Tax=Methylobacterium haplocladii TaxID=1176176 RepID=A0A512IM21_9HYPH|nr:flagellar hook-length control protein FliK [Methylobacterium haplocladii]GEO98769.1 hypothetical protein MHA02_11570 [Methylobacterium haplocladii]GJD85054.1 hypothetical protein HPGCJGGD_2940 [Methylobacterium haplocladii]